MKRFLVLVACAPFLGSAQGGWTKITTTLNPITTFTSSGTYKGAAWVDINNDGNIDLFAMPHFLFLNNGGGNFTQPGNLNINPVPTQTPGGCSWGDLNNDGKIDFITAQNPTEIYLNNGNNTFQNISAQLPGLSGYASWGCALADLDNDGRLDLLYAHANGFHGAATPQPCKLFMQNAGIFSFTQKTGYRFTDSLAPYTVPYFHDYDLDGDMDLFIASGPGGSPGPDYCYRNMKKETGLDTLYKMTSEPWALQLQDGQCYNCIDYDNDGDLDLCLTNYSGAVDRFYRNDGNSVFTSLTTPFTNMVPHLSNSWGDFDNDGDLDVMTASDNSSLKYYRNNGDGTFTALVQTLATTAGNSCIISCDYDNDGDLDVFIHGANSARSLYRNDTVAVGRNWVNYTLKGTLSNASAIGAILKLKAVINGISTWQIRTVTAQNSFQGQNDLRQHVGLGNAGKVDSVLIFWPSGLREFYVNKNVNQFESLVEGNGTLVGLGKSQPEPQLNIYPNPANSSVTLICDESMVNSSIRIFDLDGKQVLHGMLLKTNITLDLEQLAAGTYLLSLQKSNNSVIRKILVEK